MVSVAVQDPLPGSYSSAEATYSVLSPRTALGLGVEIAYRPATSTVPFGRRVAVKPWRDTDMLPVTVQDPLSGSYSSAEARLSAPATSTLPSGRSVALWKTRSTPMLPVAVQVPRSASYTSAEARTRPSPPKPPATSTLPSDSSVAVKSVRTSIMFPVAVHDPLVGSYSSAEVSRG